ncbi:MAG: hypothetical protein AAGA75_16830 [Cyanobacteria bacterium P01_E01_bin.6]
MHVVNSSADLIRRLTRYYLREGYWYFVKGRIPDHKSIEQVDAKLSAKYETTLSRWQRHRRKAKGLATIQYLRYERDFVLIATDGEHPLFFGDRSVKDARKYPIEIWYYWIRVRSSRRYEVIVAPWAYHVVKDKVLRLAREGNAAAVEEQITSLKWINYPGVNRQKHKMIAEAKELLKRRGKQLSFPLGKTE